MIEEAYFYDDKDNANYVLRCYFDEPEDYQIIEIVITYEFERRYVMDYGENLYGLSEKEFLNQLSEKSNAHYKTCSAKALKLLEKYKENIFATEFISDEEAEMLYGIIMTWKDNSDIYEIYMSEL